MENFPRPEVEPYTLLPDERAFVQHHHRRNISFNIGAEAFWGIAIGVTHPVTVLPFFLSQLGASRLLIGLIQTISMLGYSLPQLLSGFYTEGLSSKRLVFFFCHSGLILPWLVLAAFLLIPGAHNAGPTMIAFFISYAVWSASMGVIVPIWADYIHKIIMPGFRGRFLAALSFTSGIAGVVVSVFSSRLLTAFQLPKGFGICALIAGVCVSFAAASLLFEKELPFPAQRPHRTLLAYIGSLLALLRGSRRFAMLVLAKSLLTFSTMPLGFFAVYASERLQSAGKLVGFFTGTVVATQTLCCLLFGHLADRRGHKLVAGISGLAAFLAIIVAIVARGLPEFVYLFVLVGIFNATFYMSHMNMVLDLSPHRDKTSYVATANVVPAAATALAPLLGGWLIQTFSYRLMFAVALLPVGLGLAVLAFLVREPIPKAHRPANL